MGCNILIRIDAGYAVFGLEADSTGKIIAAAPIGRKFLGRDGMSVIMGFLWSGAEVLVDDGKGWRLPRIPATIRK